MDRRTFLWGIGSLGGITAVRGSLTGAAPAAASTETAATDEPLLTTREFVHPEDLSPIPHSTLQIHALHTQPAAVSFFQTIMQGPPEFTGHRLDGLDAVPGIEALGEDWFASGLVPIEERAGPHVQGLTVRIGTLVALWGAQSFVPSTPETWRVFHTFAVGYLGKLQDRGGPYALEDLRSLLPAPEALGPGWRVRPHLIDGPSERHA